MGQTTVLKHRGFLPIDGDPLHKSRPMIRRSNPLFMYYMFESITYSCLFLFKKIKNIMFGNTKKKTPKILQKQSLRYDFSTILGDGHVTSHK